MFLANRERVLLNQYHENAFRRILPSLINLLAEIITLFVFQRSNLLRGLTMTTDAKMGLNICEPRCEALYASGIYEPLITNEQVLTTIRLVALHPGENSDRVQCEIVHNVPLVSLNSQGEQVDFAEHEQPDFASQFEVRNFSALSYCRSACSNDNDETDVVIINGLEFSLNRSLVEAMRLMRERLDSETSTHLVWVDQLCINQTDPAESAQQVTLMRDIYGQADTVFACLGPDEEGYGAKAAGSLWFWNSRQLELSEHGQGLSYALGRRRDELYRDAQGYEDPSSDDHKSLSWLCSHKWFNECWNLQPFLLAQDLRFLSENFSFQAEEFIRSLVLLTWLDSGSENEYLMPVIPFLNLLRFAAARWTPDLVPYMNTGSAPKTPFAPIPLHLALPLAAGKKCVDPRDNIYSILCLLDQSLYRIQPSYSAEDIPKRAFIDATKALIGRFGDLDIIVPASRKSGNVQDLPSWTPDYSQLLTRPTFARLWDPETEAGADPEIVPRPQFIERDEGESRVEVLRCTVMVLDESILPGGVTTSHSYGPPLESDRAVLPARCGTAVLLRHVRGRTYRLLSPATSENLDVNDFQRKMLSDSECPWVFSVDII